MRITADQRAANEDRIRAAIDRLLRGEIPSGGRCDIKTLARESGFSELGRCARNCLVRAYLWPPASLMALVTR